jgi:hypothetical protein
MKVAQRLYPGNYWDAKQEYHEVRSGVGPCSAATGEVDVPKRVAHCWIRFHEKLRRVSTRDSVNSAGRYRPHRN